MDSFRLFVLSLNVWCTFCELWNSFTPVSLCILEWYFYLTSVPPNVWIGS